MSLPSPSCSSHTMRVLRGRGAGGGREARAGQEEIEGD